MLSELNSAMRIFLLFLAMVTLFMDNGAFALTNMPADDVPLSVPESAQGDLAALKALKKFNPDGGLYNGISDPTKRHLAQAAINLTIDGISQGLNRHSNKAFILTNLKRCIDFLEKLDLTDSEDREQAAKYLEKIMDAVGLDSSDGLLNNFVYGFDPNKVTVGSP